METQREYIKILAALGALLALVLAAVLFADAALAKAGPLPVSTVDVGENSVSCVSSGADAGTGGRMTGTRTVQ